MKKQLKTLIVFLILAPMLLSTAYAQSGVKITYAGQVADSITFNGVTVNAIYAPYNSVKNYGSDTTYSCAAFVKKFYKAVYGIEVYNLIRAGGGPRISSGTGSFYKVSSPQMGDIIHYLTSETTHWSIVKSVSANGAQFTVIEQNGWNDSARTQARVGKTYKVGESGVTIYRYSNAPQTVIVTTNAATNITSTSAQLNGSLKAAGSVHITEHGVYLGTSTSDMKKVAVDTVNYNKSSLTMFYSTSKYGTTLKSGTTYCYYQYAVVDGKTVTGDVVYFTTLSDSSQKGTVSGTSGGLAINDKPAASPSNSTQIGRIPEGATCTVYTDKTSGSWYYVEYNGVKGYAYKNYIKLDSSSSSSSSSANSSNSSSPSSSATVKGIISGTSGALAINDKPAASPSNSTQIGRIPEGATCTVYPAQTSGNWYYVEYNGVKGYASKNYIKLDSSSSSSSSSANSSNSSAVKGTISGTSGALAINDKPAASPSNSTQIGRIPEGAICTVYTDKTSGSWYYVEYNGVKGYAYKSYITLK